MGSVNLENVIVLIDLLQSLYMLKISWLRIFQRLNGITQLTMKESRTEHTENTKIEAFPRLQKNMVSVC